MASSDVVQYRSPLRTLGTVLTTAFLAVYVVWTVLPIFIMFVSSLKDLLEAFKLAGGRRLGRHHACSSTSSRPSSTTTACSPT